MRIVIQQITVILKIVLRQAKVEIAMFVPMLGSQKVHQKVIGRYHYKKECFKDIKKGHTTAFFMLGKCWNIMKKGFHFTFDHHTPL